MFIAAVLLTAACAGRSGQPKLHQMGESVQLNNLIYTVQEVEWVTELATHSGSKVPRGRFAVIRVNVNNTSGQTISVPLLALESEGGDSFPELTQIDGSSDWLGLLRMLDPGESIQGNIVFDVSPGTYRLRLGSGGDPATETSALVQIPLELPKSNPKPELPTLPSQQ